MNVPELVVRFDICPHSYVAFPSVETSFCSVNYGDNTVTSTATLKKGY